MTDRIKKLRGRIYIGQLAALAVLSAGWWGILYPNLSLTEETFQAVPEQKDSAGDAYKEQTTGEARSGIDNFLSLLEASPDEIEIRSKILDTLLRGKENE